MTSPQILCITNDFGPRAGGIETFVIGLIERLPKGSVIVYTSSQENSAPFDAAWQKNFGVEVVRDKSKILLPTLRVGRQVRALASERGIEKVFFGAAAPLGLLSHGLRRVGVKKIVALTHGHEVWWAKIWPFSSLLRRIGSGVDHLTFLGEFTRSEISRALTTSAQDAMVKIAPGIDTNHFSPQERAEELKEQLGLGDKKIIISVGRLVHRKGQDTLVEALPLILRQVPNAHLVFVGEGPRQKYMMQRADKLGIRDHITFIGRIQYKDLPQYICIGDLFAMPSRSRFGGLEVEGLGIVYLEASSCGLPVLGGTSGGAPDAVIHGETGLVVDGTSAHDVAEAATALLLDEALSLKYGLQGRQWVNQEWLWENWATRFSALLIEDQPFSLN
jgi:phosphatidylinositol alpha-1,6-mannosyltransferase